MIQIEKLTKSYGKHKVLKGISLAFNEGQSVALIGPNGSGKTTLLKSILGLVLPDGGSITINGQEIKKSYAYRQQIGYMPQINRFPEHMKVHQLFDMLKKMRPDVSQSQYDVQLYEAFNIDTMSRKSLGALSGGMRQQVSAAVAFLFSPKIVILDEPTAALDPVSNEMLKEKINEVVKQDKLVLTTSHILSDLDDIANEVVYLMDGEVVFFKGIDELREETSETRLNKIIARMMNKQFEYVES